MDPNRTWCPEVGCETICHVCSSSIVLEHVEGQQAKAVHCPSVSGIYT